MKSQKPLLIDTDAGVDDALAIIFALRSPEVSVKAITTVAGNVEVHKCTRNVRTIVEMLGVESSPAIARGSAKPLRRRLFTAPEVHGKDGLGNTQPSLKRVQSNVGTGAVDLIIECCRKYGRELTVVALGPLTNIARAWEKNRTALRSMGRLVTMGGAFQVPGNTGPVAEFNYFVDPEAANIVLNSGLPITMVPLDLTEQVVLLRKDLDNRAVKNDLARFVARFTKVYMLYHQKTEGFFGGYLHDPVAMAAAMFPFLFQTRQTHVVVETHGTLTRGMTIADDREGRKKKALVNVAYAMDTRKFIELFHRRMWQ